MSSKRKQPAPPADLENLTPLPGEPVFRRLDPALLLPPLNPARETFDDAALADLVESIPVMGILENLIVEQEGDRFRIHAGHRRWVAAQALKLALVPCMVYAPGACQGEAIKHHENAYREDLNAAQEARYFGRVLKQECGDDVDVLCQKLRESRDYVEGRLLLLQGDNQVLEALGNDLIGIGVAHQLNLIPDEPTRMMYLDVAIRGGATVRMVRDWRVQWEKMQSFIPDVESMGNVDAFKPAVAAMTTMACFLCDSSESPHDMELLYAHRTCRRLFLDRFLANIKGAPESVEA